jgi:hypothetical protein
MKPESAALTTTTASGPAALERHAERRWTGFGAALGAAATSGVGVGVALLAGPLVGAAVTVPAALLGARFGRRWRRRVARDADSVPVKRWLARLSGDGAVFAGASAGTTAALIGATILGSLGLLELAKFVVMAALLAAPAGALTVAAVGVPFFVSLGRGERPWVALILAALLGPAALAGTLAVISFFATMFF